MDLPPRRDPKPTAASSSPELSSRSSSQSPLLTLRRPSMLAEPPIEVAYEELPAVYDPVAATQPGAPLIHEPDDVRAFATPLQNVADYPNSVSNPVWGASPDEMEAAFGSCAHVFEHEFHTPVQHQG